jgi:hypothetical protein
MRLVHSVPLKVESLEQSATKVAELHAEIVEDEMRWVGWNGSSPTVETLVQPFLPCRQFTLHCPLCCEGIQLVRAVQLESQFARELIDLYLKSLLQHGQS